MQKIIGVTDLQRRFRTIFDEVSKLHVPYVLTRGSRPEAALIPYDSYVRFQQMQETSGPNPIDGITVERAAEQSVGYATKQTTTEIPAEMARALVDVRLTAMGVAKPIIEEFCQRHHIRKLSLFGSVTRTDFTAESDVDVLVEFEPGFTPGFEFFSMQEELSRLLGRQVDLQTPGFLSKRFREDVMKEAEICYVAE